MPNFHDPYIQFVTGITIAVIAILVGAFVALLVYFKQKNKKELSYTLVSSAPIVSVKPDVADRIKIYLDGNAITQAQLAVFSLKNTGNLAVKREDYDEPIVIEFPQCKILDANILSTRPKDLLKPEDQKTFFKWGNSTLTLAKCLLNRKEELQFSVLVEGSEVEPKVRTRIVDGVLSKEKPALRLNIVFSILTSFMSIITLLIATVASPANPYQGFSISILIIMLLFIILVAIMQWIFPLKRR